jgi:hypothetical protein
MAWSVKAAPPFSHERPQRAADARDERAAAPENF